MAITSDLRKFLSNSTLSDWTLEALADIADRIDVEHRSALEKLAAQLDETSDMRDFIGRIEQAATNREDVQLWGVDYVPLPVDADGVPVRVGDVMEWPTTGETFEVVGIGDGTLFYVDGNGCECADWTGASTKRHHHKPTVEDVLREFADRVCNSGHQWGLDAAGTIAEFAKLLRLAEEVDG